MAHELRLAGHFFLSATPRVLIFAAFRPRGFDSQPGAGSVSEPISGLIHDRCNHRLRPARAQRKNRGEL